MWGALSWAVFLQQKCRVRSLEIRKISRVLNKGMRVTFTIYDKDEFELDSDSEEIYVPGKGTGKARGKMLVSPPEKARRMARQGASLSLR